MSTPILKSLKQFDEGSKKLKLVGHTKNGYRLWNEKERKIVSRCDVIFNEITGNKGIN